MDAEIAVGQPQHRFQFTEAELGRNGEGRNDRQSSTLVDHAIDVAGFDRFAHRTETCRRLLSTYVPKTTCSNPKDKATKITP